MTEFVDVRPATDADLSEVLTFDHSTPAARERPELLTRCVRDGACLLAWDDDHLLGYIAGARESFFGRDFVERLVVARDARRHGVGRRLLRAFVASAQTPTVFASTNVSNGPMIRLLAGERWCYSGRLDGLDANDPELVYWTPRDVTGAPSPR